MNMNSNFDKRNPFTVPDGYFEDFASKMASMTQTSMPSLAWYKKTKSWIAIAATLSGVLIGAKLLMPVEMASKTVAQQHSVEESYILSQMDESSLANYLCNADAEGQTSNK
ncbi:hypothetical protein [Paludibacter sp.]|uniref:hypothetical protein n=1 Tax=Paludibacter sp. TaxID=1898105 RepID=UPI0013547CD2|nr:hypothetical protein [Paludibacter sp.]MTK53127.1 hypothetical protein [Paludibacter sp.]